MAATKLSEIKKYADGFELEIPGWDADKPVKVKLRRPSIMALAAQGGIPNPLLGAAEKLFRAGPDKAGLKDMADVLLIIVKAALVSPSYEDLDAAGLQLTDQQMLYIYNFCQTGVDALRRFRQQQAAVGGNSDGKGVQPAAEPPVAG